jgi:predicted enzyme related to lactoylglutathione lyase
MQLKNAISWFEIPATDINRAQKFYESIFDFNMIPMDLQQIQMRLFPITDMINGVGGPYAPAVDSFPENKDPGYLNANPDVQLVLDKIEAAGGKILVPKTQISPEYGHMAVLLIRKETGWRCTRYNFVICSYEYLVI